MSLRTRKPPRSAVASPAMKAVVLLVVAAIGTVGLVGSSGRLAPVKSGASLATLSGTVVDAQSRALPGVVVRLDGPIKGFSTTDRNGAYTIVESADAPSGDYSLEAVRTGCAFAPAVAPLSRLKEHEVVNFTGTGSECTGTLPVALHSASAVDPGPRPGPPGAGGPVIRSPSLQRAEAEQAAGPACIEGLAEPTRLLCKQAFIRFQEVDSVSGGLEGEEGVGLGPTFNGNSCAMCHSQPAVLGSSPGPSSPQSPRSNPQVALATRDGARNVVPPFITSDGPIRVVRFKSDNDVHDLFTITGRSDARGCHQHQPDFATNLAAGNVSFRIPLALFGLGFVEAVSEATLKANLAESSSPELGIAGTFNVSSNDGTISRFGRKAQNKSLLLFASEAYNVEIGVTSEMFPQERYAERGCTLNGTPEDMTDPTRVGSVSETSSDIVNFALAIRLSAPPVPAVPQGVARASVEGGSAEFENIGCANCHAPKLTTSTSNLDPALSGAEIHPFSDFALHHMGTGLADGIVQGSAGPDQFRTTPLWGVGQRLFFLHDGRTSDLVEAIEAHASPGSEATAVIANFNVLSMHDQQDLVNFLRSL